MTWEPDEKAIEMIRTFAAQVESLTAAADDGLETRRLADAVICAARIGLYHPCSGPGAEKILLGNPEAKA